MKKKKFYDSRLFLINLPEFRVDILISINQTEKEIISKTKKIGMKDGQYKQLTREIDDWGELDTEGRMVPFIDGGYMILLKLKKDRFRKSVGTIIHEVAHCIHYLLRDRRIPLNEDTEEIYTYLQEYLATEILNAIY